MNYQVPQFIEVEDKLFGQLTFKQFLYLAGGGGLCFVIYRFISFLPLALLFIAIVAGISIALAFFKINSKPLIFIMEAAFGYLTHSKLYLWKKVDKKPERNAQAMTGSSNKSTNGFSVPRLSESRLKDLAWSLDIHESIYSSKDQK